MNKYAIRLTAIAAITALCLAVHAGAQPKPQAVLEQVQQHLSEKQPGKAVNKAEKAISQYESAQQALQVRLRVTRLVLDHYLQLGNGKKAVQTAVENLVQKTPGEARESAYLMGGRVHIFINEYKAAHQTLTEYLDEFPRPSKKQLEEYADKKGQDTAEAARQHPRLVRRQLAREMLGRLSMMGEKIPPFQVTNLSGEVVSRKDLTGSPAVLIFWRASPQKPAEWIKLMAQVYNEYNSRGLRIIGLSVNSDKTKLTSFLEQNNLPWSNVFLGGRREEICRKFGILTLYPASVLIDSEGVIRGVDLKGAALGQQVRELLRGEGRSGGQQSKSLTTR